MKIVLERSQASLDMEKPGREVNCTRFEVLQVAKHKIKRLLRSVHKRWCEQVPPTEEGLQLRTCLDFIRWMISSAEQK